MAKAKLRTGDKVIIIAGKDKGKSGAIKQMLLKKDKVVVEGLNKVKKHVKPSNDDPGGIVEVEAPLHISNVMLIDPKDGTPTRVGRRIEGGKSVRYAKKSQEIIK